MATHGQHDFELDATYDPGVKVKTWSDGEFESDHSELRVGDVRVSDLVAVR